MFLKDLAHGVIDGVHRTAAAGGDQLFVAENFDEHGSLSVAAMAFDRLKVHLIVDLAAQDAKGFQIILTPLGSTSVQKTPRHPQAEKSLLSSLSP